MKLHREPQSAERWEAVGTRKPSSVGCSMSDHFLPSEIKSCEQMTSMIQVLDEPLDLSSCKQSLHLLS